MHAAASLGRPAPTTSTTREVPSCHVSDYKAPFHPAHAHSLSRTLLSCILLRVPDSQPDGAPLSITAGRVNTPPVQQSNGPSSTPGHGPLLGVLTHHLYSLQDNTLHDNSGWAGASAGCWWTCPPSCWPLPHGKPSRQTTMNNLHNHDAPMDRWMR